MYRRCLELQFTYRHAVVRSVLAKVGRRPIPVLDFDQHVVCMRIQGLIHIVYLIQTHENRFRHVTHAKGSLRAPPSLGIYTLLQGTNSSDLRCIAQLGAIRPGTLPRHSAALAGVVG